MKQYEFMSVPMSSADLSTHGLAGWALKAVHDGIAFLEREIMPSPQAFAEPVAAEPASVVAAEPAPAPEESVPQPEEAVAAEAAPPQE